MADATHVERRHAEGPHVIRSSDVRSRNQGRRATIAQGTRRGAKGIRTVQKKVHPLLRSQIWDVALA